MGKAKSGFRPGVATGSTPSQGGSHSPAATGATVITGEDRPGVQAMIPKAPTNSPDGVILRARRETHIGWYRVEDVKEVEV